MLGTDPSELQLLQYALHTDFLSFLRKVFEQLNPHERLDPNWHHEAIQHLLDQVRAGEVSRLLVTMPPRNLKSIIISVAWPAWVLGHAPGMDIICVSYNQDLAAKLARDCRSVMMSEWYSRLFPGTRLERTAENDLRTTAGGGRLSTSIGGTLTGRGADIVIIDDPQKPEEAMSETERTRVNSWIRQTLMSRLNDKQSGIIVVVMQRLHEDDLAGNLIETGRWAHLSLAAIAEQDENVPIGGGRVHHRRAGDVLHPSRESRETLERLKVDLGSMVFAAQYQQAPVPAGGNLVQRVWLKRYDTPPVGKPGYTMVQSWDTASKDGPMTDWSVCITALVKGTEVCVIDVFRARLNFPDLLRAVEAQATRWRPKSLLIEDAASGQQLIQSLNHARHRAIPKPIPIRPEGDKTTRLSAQCARIEAGELLLPREAPWLASFEHELLGFPGGRHDDQADALVQLLGWVSRNPVLRLIKPPLMTRESCFTRDW